MSSNLRAITKFLWLPKKDNGKWYWLKKVTIIQRKVVYKITEWPLIPWGFGGALRYLETRYEFVGIADMSNAKVIFVPDRDSPEP